LPGEIAQTHTPTQNGNYEVEIDTLGCKYKSSAYVFGSYSIAEWLNKNIRIYPIPARNIVNIEITEKLTHEKNSIEIIDVLGKNVFKEELNSELNIISVSQLNAGIYFAILKSGNHTITKKIIVE
jgi:hypothetical protein